MQGLAMVEYYGGCGDAERVAQLANKEITRGNIVLVGERRLACRDIGGTQQQWRERCSLQKGRYREKPGGRGRRPDVNEVDADSAHHQRSQSDQSKSA